MPNDLLARKSPLLSQKLWIAAVVQHQKIWDDWEGEFYKAMQRTNTKIMRAGCHRYSVDRTISSDEKVWSKLRACIRNAHIKGKRHRERLESFANQVEKIACAIGKLQRNGRPISAVSKLLIQLHPDDGFIYDKNAQRVVQKICGKPTKADAILKYRDFVQDYSDIFCALREKLVAILDNQGSELQAARIIDKFLWLQGTRDAKQRVRTLVKNASGKQVNIASRVVSFLQKFPD